MQPIAIIGASCRFPGANGLDEFWQLLREGRNAVTAVPKDRWDSAALLDSNPDSRAHIATAHGAFISNIREFDCGFFGISPREAAAMDPQQRLLLETAYEGFEDAGIPMEALAGSQTAVYVGIGPGDYGRMCAQPLEEITAHYVTGNFLSTAVDRISYFFDLRGPCMALDTACSSSLVSLHLACRSLETGEADLAMAGGVNALLAPTLSISLAKAGALSSLGQCRSFDAQADGYVRGEGCGFVILKRLDQALKDSDRIYAVVRGTAVRQGGRRNGLTAPGGWGEEAVMNAAWQAAAIAPTKADYIEAQGTGTPLGDAIEANAISKVFGLRNGLGPCRIGSVKTNIGHLETASGIAGLLKVALMISHGEFVPSLFSEQPNPHINSTKLSIAIQTSREPWPLNPAEGRIAGVSSFGMGGTYAHACLTSPETQPAVAPQDIASPLGFLLPLSARQPDALRELVRQTAVLVERTDADSLAHLCRAAGARRTHHEYRVGFAGVSPADLVLRMNSWLQQNFPTAKVSGKRKLAVLVSQKDDSAFAQQTPSSSQLLQTLERWGIPPVRTLRFLNGRILSEDSGASTSEIDLEKLRKSGTDFLDLTCEKFLARTDFPIDHASLLSADSLSEPSPITPIQIAAQLYTLGYPISWREIYPGAIKQVNLPRYPWQHQECWLDWLNKKSAAELLESERPSRVLVQPAGESSREVLARITGLPVHEIRSNASPRELGIDSLLTLELQEGLRRISGKTIPVETLLQVKTVAELELLLEDNRATHPQPPPAAGFPVTADQGHGSTEIREASLGQYEQIAAVILKSGLGVKTREQWEHIWVNNPVFKKHPDWPIGWVVLNGGDIVGFMGNIPLMYHFQGREILASGLHAFALDPSHRGLGLLLLNRLLEFAPRVLYFVGSTANSSSSKVLDRVGIGRMPVGNWGSCPFWITNYDGFVRSAVTKKGWPSSLASLASPAVKIYDTVTKTPWPKQTLELNRHNGFDTRFDVFWKELQRVYPNRFLAMRSRDVLDWHFRYSLARDRAWVVTHEVNSRVCAYAIFQRQDYPDINLKRVRLVDFQALPDGNQALPSMLSWGLNESRAHGIHMLEAFGFRPEKQAIIDRLAPHRRQLAAWAYFHKVVSPTLQQELQDPSVWDPSPFDGDASL